MSDKRIRLVTKIWLAACLVVLAVALVPVFVPTASLHARYTTPHSNRLQRHSFSNVAKGRPDARVAKISHEPLPFALLSLIRRGPNPSPWLQPVSSARPLLSLLPHRRKLGRANPGDPDLLV
jgi:hypothetical protein